MAHIGIDIGTSNTVVAVATDNGHPEVRRIKDDALVPSVIAVTEHGGNCVAGRDAVDEWANPDRDAREIFRRWKLLMGDEKVLATMRFGGPTSSPVDITPEWLTTRLVEYVLGEITSGVGGEEVDSVLITVPHGWRRDTPHKCQATRQAAAMAQVDGKLVEVQNKTVSEPVAAAVYWLWEAQRDTEATSAKQYAGKHILVCDVGGGTFDLSLVRVGADGEPLVVVDAINNNYAGDYVTALIMARAAEQFNAEFNTSLPTEADEILRQLGESPTAGMRAWFVELQQMQKDLSTRIAFAARSGREPRQKRSVVLQQSEDSDDQITFSMTAAQFIETLESFYAHGRELVRTFLRSHGAPTPYAVVFAGGGSRIAGVANNIVGAALRDIAPRDVDEILNRIQINDHKIDQAIALGAALVASGVVKVEERILCDIGLEVTLGEDLAKQLNATPGEVVLMTPILPRGSTLPARFSSQDYKFFIYVPAGNSVDIKIVIDDDPVAPYIQSWEEAIPASSPGDHECSVIVYADADGALDVRLSYFDGYETNVRGRLSRERTGRSKLVISGQERSMMTTAYRLRITPQQFVDALTRLRTGRNT